MRLELQFKTAQVVVRGIADMDVALKIIMYLNGYHPVCEEEVRCALPLPRTIITTPALILPAVTQERFWEYSSYTNEQSTLYTGPFDAVVDDLYDERYDHHWHDEKLQSSAHLPAMLDAVPAWPWTEARQAQRMERLQSLQVAREIHMHGFDVEELARRLKEQALPAVMVPVHLYPGEVAYYMTASMLSDVPATNTGWRDRFRTRDRGTFILTNKRAIYLGRKQQMVLGYEHLLQASYTPGAIVLFSKYWSDRKFFVMKRPLECSMYFEHLLQKFQRSFSLETTQARIRSTSVLSPPSDTLSAMLSHQ
jgi:hypothetical protein